MMTKISISMVLNLLLLKVNRKTVHGKKKTSVPFIFVNLISYLFRYVHRKEKREKKQTNVNAQVFVYSLILVTIFSRTVTSYSFFFLLHLTFLVYFNCIYIYEISKSLIYFNIN